MDSSRVGSARERYLHAAVTMARQRPDPPPNLAAQLSFREVATHLGVSRTALYRRWATHAEFVADLNRFVSLGGDFSRSDDTLLWTDHLCPSRTSGDAIAPGAPIDDVDPIEALEGPELETLRVEFNALHRAILVEPFGVTTVMQLAYGEEPELARLRARMDHRRLEQIAEVLVRRLHDQFGLRVRQPYTAFDVAVAEFCMGSGLYALNRFAPDIADATIELGDQPGDGPWNILGLSYLTIILRGVEPVPPGARSRYQPPWPSTSAPELPGWTPAQLDILESAANLVRERLLSGSEGLTVLPHVTIERIARVCGVSRRAVYDVWPHRDDLMLDLLVELLADEQRELEQAIDDAFAHGTDLSVAAITDRITAPRPADLRGELTQAATAYLPAARRPAIAAAVASAHRHSVEHLADRLVTLPDIHRVRDHRCAVEHLATALVAMDAGARRLHRSCPGVARTAAMTGELSALGMAATALASG